MTGIGIPHPDLYIMRHGETVWNQAGRFQGRRDSALTDAGRDQALRLRDILMAAGAMASMIFCSPQGRALQTARLAFGDSAAIRVDDRLQEIDFGSWEGMTRSEVARQINGRDNGGLWNFESPGGEDFAAIAGRVERFLSDLGDPAIIVTHGMTSCVLRGLCMGLDQAALLRLPKDHGCVYHLSAGRQTVLR